MARTIDLNADLGEDPRQVERDRQLLRFISSANIACGGHAGDEETMRAMVAAALQSGASVGAHPSFPDRANFGRVALNIDPAQLQESLTRQIATIGRIARDCGTELRHVKPHGALYHAANADQEIATAVARATCAWSPQLILVGQAGSKSLQVWRGMGLGVAAEAFADRQYERNGSLRSRTSPGALITEAAAAARQAVSIATSGQIQAADGWMLQIQADTICLHSDTPGAVEIAQCVHQALLAAGVLIQPLTRG